MWSMSGGKEGLKRFEGEGWVESEEMRFTGSGAEGESGISRTSRAGGGADMGGFGFLVQLGVEATGNVFVLRT